MEAYDRLSFVAIQRPALIIGTMDEATSAILRSWNWRFEVLLPLLLFGGTFSLGWWRLRRLPRSVHLAKVWRLFFYWLGLILLALALISPIETLSGQLFSMHMIQHLLLGMFAPPLLMSADPLPILMWGLPLRVRRGIGRILLSRSAPARPILQKATRPLIAWLTFFVFLWGWHDSNLYNLTLVSEWAHDLEHLTFFASAMLLWWHITGAGPRFHRRFNYPARIGLTLGCIPANMVLGVAIALANGVIYTYYETVPFRIWDISVLDDQRLGGAIMWVPGSMMYVIAVIALVGLWLSAEERQAAPTVAQLSDSGKFDAPHLEGGN